MVRYCYVCNRKQAKNEDLCLHKFPRNPEICLKWKQFCGLRETDDVRAVYICSFHFCLEDFRLHTLTLPAKKQLLNPGAIPSIRCRKRQIVKNAESLRIKKRSKVNKDETIIEEPQLEVLKDTNEYVEPQINVQEYLTDKIEPVFVVGPQKDNSSSVNVLTNVSRSVNELCSIPTKGEYVETSYISELQSEIKNYCDENIKPEINVPFPHSSVQIETTRVVSPLQDNLFLQNVLGNVPRSPANNLCLTPKRRRYAEPRYISEIMTSDVQTPRRASRIIKFVKNNDIKRQEHIKKLQKINRNLMKRIKTLENMLSYLKETQLISEHAEDFLLNMMPEIVKELITRKIRDKGRYSAKLRSFALTLHFYSPKAYNYVRKIWSLLLPHPSTIKQWYRVVDIDEMSIREQIIYNQGKFHGGVDFGTLDNENNNDSMQTAKSALVFMAVSLNDNWKVPIAYFLISSLSGQERSNLLSQALEMLHDSNAHVFSITFDGAPTNLSMCTHLGANFQYGHNFKPYFTNPVTLKKCFVFFDICHMIKLIRNTLGDKKMLKTSDNEIISWQFFEKLHELQQRKGLKAANKLSNKHINFSNNRMNVKLAMQTLSESVYKPLRKKTLNFWVLNTEKTPKKTLKIWCEFGPSIEGYTQLIVNAQIKP